MKAAILFVSLFLLVSADIKAQNRYDSLIEKAKTYEVKSPDSVLLYARMALSEEVENQSDAYYWLGVGYRMKRSFDTAQLYYEKSLNLSVNELQKANAYMGLGGINYTQKIWDEAINYFLNAAKIFEKLKRRDRLGAAYSNIGIIMNANNNDEKASYYFKEAIRIFDEEGMEGRKLPSLVNLAALFQKNDQYDSAIFYAEQCYNISKGQNFKFGVSQSLITLAPAYTLIGQPQKGYDLAVEAEELFKEFGIENSVLLMRFYQAKALLQLGKLNQALSICKALESQAGSGPSEEHLYELMAQIFEQLGDTGRALIYYQKFHKEYEAYLTEQQAEFIDELEKKYESQKQENEIASLENMVALKEIESSRKTWIVSFIVVAMLFLLVIGWLYYQRLLSIEKERAAVHKQQLLRSQINPHFIFNSLSSIRGFLFNSEDTKPAITYLGQFAKLMRMVLDLSAKEWVTLEEEITALELYLAIQQIRFNKGFQFNLEIDPSINPADVIVPPLTAQPFVENAIEHGLKGMSQGGKVEIKCLKNKERIQFEIKDNGIGIDHAPSSPNHQSKAIQIFKERLGIIGKRMKTTFAFDISDIGHDNEQQGTLVSYELPLLTSSYV